MPGAYPLGYAPGIGLSVVARYATTSQDSLASL